MVENCSLVAFTDLLTGINFQVVHIFSVNCGVEISMKCSHEPHEKLVSKQQSGGLYMYII